MNDNEILLSNLIDMPIQGESNLTNPRNQQYNLKTKPSETKTQELTENNEETAIDFITDNPSNTNTSNRNMIDFVTDKWDQQQQVSVWNQWQQAPQNQVINKPWSHRTRIPTRYIRDIQSSIRTADNRPGNSNLPTSIHISEQITQIEGETEDTGQTELVMAAAVSKIEAIDPLSLKEAMGRPDYSRWETAIHEELNNLQKAGTWTIVERPKDRNIVKKDAAGKIKQYKARLITKGFMQVQGVHYYNTWAPVAKLRSIWFLLSTATQHGWPINMFDFHSMFLNGELDSDEEVFMEQSQAYEKLDKKWYVCM